MTDYRNLISEAMKARESAKKQVLLRLRGPGRQQAEPQQGGEAAGQERFHRDSLVCSFPHGNEDDFRFVFRSQPEFFFPFDARMSSFSDVFVVDPQHTPGDVDQPPLPFADGVRVFRGVEAQGI